VVRQAESIELKNRLIHPDGTVSLPKTDPTSTVPLAGWWRRAGSGVIDTIIAVALTAVLLIGGAPTLLQRWLTQMNAHSRELLAWAAAPSFTLPAPSEIYATTTSTVGVLFGIVTIVYCALFLGFWGATIGHRICGVNVIKSPHPSASPTADKKFTIEKPGWIRAVSKAMSWALFCNGGFLILFQVLNVMILFLVVNVFLPLWHRRKQSLTDLFAGTLLVLRQPEPPEIPG
jgi:uncharacterized RDD family membrane protein YckC